MRRTLGIGTLAAVIAAALILGFGQVAAQTPAAPPSASVASYNATAKTANISTTAFYTVPASTGFGPAPLQGKYDFKCYVVITTAGSVSSTMPSCGVAWTDADSATAESVAAVTSTSSSNTVGTYSGAGQVIDPAAGSVVSISTASYAASSSASMQYSVHASLIYLGN